MFSIQITKNLRFNFGSHDDADDVMEMNFGQRH